ncbi:hypothetical protein L1987_53172 [Smallanthus sonchifolius]|uniref:Uncharacterized protein n=1 Tax=Smallanthus sonchifolius TaxID=185202 RepID=A0ACB9EWB5_9ASTR|nr:hypothetical protein L1987_53172 [Smallanthus sonchifolius]
MATSLSTPLPVETQQPEEQEPMAQGQVQSSGSIGLFFAILAECSGGCGGHVITLAGKEEAKAEKGDV